MKSWEKTSIRPRSLTFSTKSRKQMTLPTTPTTRQRTAAFSFTKFLRNFRQNLNDNNYCWYYQLISNDIYPIKTNGRRESPENQRNHFSSVSYNICYVSYEKDDTLKYISNLMNAQVRYLPGFNHRMKQKLHDPAPVQNKNDFHQK